MLIFGPISGGKHISERKVTPSRKCIAIDLEMKISIIRKYEGGQRLSALEHIRGFAVSAVTIIMKHEVCVRCEIYLSLYTCMYVH
jgi:hypothetical protein